MRVMRILPLVAAAALTVGSAAAQEGPFDRVRRAGVVVCGVDATPGFHSADPTGRPVGFDVDFCRAVAAAAIGDGEAIRLVRVATRVKFQAAASGEIDLALGQATWTMGRDTQMGVSFPTWLLIDAQGFLAWREAGIAGLPGLAGKRICVQDGTTSLGNLKDALAARGIAAELVLGATSEERATAFLQRRCDAVTGDRLELAGLRAKTTGARDAVVLLDETISREPLSPAVAAGDKSWHDVVRWTAFALMIAEARGVTQAIARDPERLGALADPEARRLMGLDGDFGKGLGLDPLWAQRAIAAVGHYGEMFERHLGAASPLGLPRGQNALWRDGGLLLPPPLR